VRSIAGRIPVTIRIGVLVARNWGNPTTEEVLWEADAALYTARAAGRNRCGVAAQQNQCLRGARTFMRDEEPLVHELLWLTYRVILVCLLHDEIGLLLLSVF
jgi:hypothetical protein